MPPADKITSYFRRPNFALTPQETRSKPSAKDRAPAVQSSPLAEPPQPFPSDATSADFSDSPSSQLKQTLSLYATDSTKNDLVPEESFQSAKSGTPFSSSSQRVVKNGREVVISSDGDDTDASETFRSPDELFSIFTTQKTSVAKHGETDHDSPSAGMTLRSRKSKKLETTSGVEKAIPVYKNTLDNLVMQAVSDNETEAGIARLKASLQADIDRENGAHSADTNLHEGMLASAIDDGTDDSLGLQRLLDAVRRTEALDLGKSWYFFDRESPVLPPPDFPRDCIPPATYIAVLREPESRERAFHSGIVDFSLSRGLLPDELIKWIFHSIPSETRDSLRHAYCRAIKRTAAERIKTVIRPDDITLLFERLGANPKALALSDPIVPETNPRANDPLPSQSQRHTALVSMLDVFREAAHHFSDDTLERILGLVLRLTLDVSLTRNSIVSLELERAITALLEGITKEIADDLATRVCTSAYTTLKDAELQSRILQHIVPTNVWIATLRRRLAFIFLTGDLSSIDESLDRKHQIKRVTNILKEPRFDIKRYKARGRAEYDYGELRAIVTFLDIIIDSGWSETKFSDEIEEQEFNSEIDLLADRVKKVFTAIEDSGASHLKRTLAKEALESLHYRIVYSVRSKPPPKKTLFGDIYPQGRNGNLLDFIQKKKKVVILSDKPDS